MHLKNRKDKDLTIKGKKKAVNEKLKWEWFDEQIDDKNKADSKKTDQEVF